LEAEPPEVNGVSEAEPRVQGAVVIFVAIVVSIWSLSIKIQAIFHIALIFQLCFASGVNTPQL